MFGFYNQFTNEKQILFLLAIVCLAISIGLGILVFQNIGFRNQLNSLENKVSLMEVFFQKENNNNIETERNTMDEEQQQKNEAKNEVIETIQTLD